MKNKPPTINTKHTPTPPKQIILPEHNIKQDLLTENDLRPPDNKNRPNQQNNNQHQQSKQQEHITQPQNEEDNEQIDNNTYYTQPEIVDEVSFEDKDDLEPSLCQCMFCFPFPRLSTTLFLTTNRYVLNRYSIFTYIKFW